MNSLNTARHMDAFYRVDDTNHRLDIRIPKQRLTNTENEAPGLLSPRYMVDARSVSHRKASPTMRQPSGSRDYKAPLGPRPPEFVSKRLTSAGFSEIPHPRTARLSYGPPTSEPFPGLAARRLISTSVTNQLLDQHGSRNQSSESGQSSPQQLFFDALQDHPLIVESFHGNSFLSMDNLPGLPASNTGVQSRFARDGMSNVASGQRSSRGSPAPIHKGSGVTATAALRAAQLSATSAFGAPVIVPLASVKRTSNSTTTNSSYNISHRPREESPLRAQIPRKAVAAMPSTQQASNRSREVAQADSSVKRKSRSDLTLSSNTDLAEDEHVGTSSRTRKPVAPPAQPSKSQFQMQLNGSSMDFRAEKEFMPDRMLPPVRPISPSTGTSLRQSSASFHTGGLGARTISPTDARRMKRLSTYNLDQAADARRRSPTPELTFGRRPEKSPQRLYVTNSPAAPSPLHSISDTSQRPAAGRTLSSHSSFNSLRPPSTSFQVHHGANHTASKPTPSQPRLSHSPVGTGGEMVPPVPAIPKAYETPSETDQQFFSHLKSDSPDLQKTTPSNQSTTRRAILETPDLKATIVTSSESRQRRGQTLSQIGSEPNTSSQMRSKNMTQSSRLPPLKLAPLSVPAAAKIDAYVEPPQIRPNGIRTPSTHRLNTIASSSPLTASKAVFPTRGLQIGSDHDTTLKRRSKTSSQYDLASIFKSNKPSPEKENGSTDRPRLSLLHSSSGFVPQYSTNLPGLEHDSSSQNQNATAVETRVSKLATLRNRALSKSHDNSKPVQPLSSTDRQSPSTGSGIRRRLSLGWRRSSSKIAFYPQTGEQVQYMKPPTVEEQVSPPLGLDGSTAGRTPPITNATLSPRLPSVASGNGTLVEADARVPTSTASRPIPIPLRSSSSLLLSSTRPQSVQAPRQELQKTQQYDPVADDEMKRLAVKRKDFESTVRDLDFQTRRAIAREPISPSLACRKVKLTIYERGEIIDYNHIYFCGNDNAEKLQADLANQATNFGFDDDRGDYNIVYGDHLAYRYEVLDPLGKGSFGQVVRCIDYKTGKLVAIKIIRNKKRFHQQALVEVNILKKLREWDPEEKHSMVNFTQSFYFRGHLCISTELLGMNLYEFIKAYDFKGFSLVLIRRFAQQMLSSLTLLHSRNVIHCDLKPENVLLSHPYRSEIKVIDFGSSCLENEKVYTYIQSRFYRSPEVILGMDYGMPIDMWSLGCILAELLIGYPIFPGENEQEQLACIMEVFGPPEKHLIELSTRKKLFFDSVGKPRIIVSTKGKRRRPSSKTLQQALKCDDEAFVDFISRCLRWDPKRRMKPTEGINHDFITGQRKTARARSQVNSSSGRLSPIKRFNTGQTPVRAKQVTEAMIVAPGPVLPSSLLSGSKQNLSTGRDRDMPTDPSPAKITATPRRMSTMNVTQGMAAKRSSTGAAIGSALPRVVPRNMTARMDLASAAAIAAQRTR